MRSVELFAGAGGLAIGMANAGFKHTAVIEWDHDACETFRENQKHNTHAVEGWPLHETDARNFDFRSIKDKVMVVSGGPPCQPFSMGGKHKGQDDVRNMFPEAIRAVRELMPLAFIFENVKGLMRPNFLPYFSYLILQLQHTELFRQSGEDWLQHRSRLEQHHTSNKKAATYNVLFDVLNAANFGVPQRRERVFIVGFRADIGARWAFPQATHSEDALLASKWITGEYWDQHGIAVAKRPQAPAKLERRLQFLRSEPLFSQQAWKTIRDAIHDLPDPEKQPLNRISNHIYSSGARTYVGHTGSRLDEPAKTLKAGYHGVPGGENMFVRDDGTVRYFTAREAARIQTFPDEYVFHGAWSQTMRQLGNAVPVRLAEVVAYSVFLSLQESSLNSDQNN